MKFSSRVASLSIAISSISLVSGFEDDAKFIIKSKSELEIVHPQVEHHKNKADWSTHSFHNAISQKDYKVRTHVRQPRQYDDEAGSITVHCEGLQSVIFSVNYNWNGNRERNVSPPINPGIYRKVIIPAGAENIFLKIREYKDKKARAVIFTQSFDRAEKKCYKERVKVPYMKVSRIHCLELL